MSCIGYGLTKYRSKNIEKFNPNSAYHSHDLELLGLKATFKMSISYY